MIQGSFRPGLRGFPGPPGLPGPPSFPGRVAQRAPGAALHGPAYQVPASALDLSRSGPGSPLPAAVQSKMEAALGATFADVRIHVGQQAPDLGARAFTVGSRIFFAPGEYQPHTYHGQRLLGHELTHVVQQRAGRVRNPFGAGLAVVQDPGLEAEAERMGLKAALPAAPARPTAGGGSLQRSGATPSRTSLSASVQRTRQTLALAGRPQGQEDEQRLLALETFLQEVLFPQLDDIELAYEPKLKAKLNTWKAQLNPLAKAIVRAKKVTGRGRGNAILTALEKVETVIGDIVRALNDSFRLYGGTYGIIVVNNQGSDLGTSHPGAPPSLWQKISQGGFVKDELDYWTRKVRKQELKEPVPFELVSKTLRTTSGGPSNVKIVLKLQDAEAVPLEKGALQSTEEHTDFTRYSKAFSIPSRSHNHPGASEYETSKGDGEVAVLAGALILCRRDFEREDEQPRNHLLAIVGPFGPCDGCKDRIKTFKMAWRKLAQKSNRTGGLTITYYYRHPTGLFRNETTRYGYFEAQRGEWHKLPELANVSGSTAEGGEYFYRTHTTRWPKPQND